MAGATASTGPAAAARIFTVGHSNHEAGPFIALLARHGIRALVDVRSIPSSGRFPHFKKRALDELCKKHGVSYRHCPELGNKAVGIVHLLRQPEGQRALAQLAAAAAEGHTAYFCAEADWRDCHRQVVSQRLMEDYGIISSHIRRNGSVELHPASHVLPACYSADAESMPGARPPGKGPRDPLPRADPRVPGLPPGYSPAPRPAPTAGLPGSTAFGYAAAPGQQAGMAYPGQMTLPYYGGMFPGQMMAPGFGAQLGLQAAFSQGYQPCPGAGGFAGEACCGGDIAAAWPFPLAPAPQGGLGPPAPSFAEAMAAAAAGASPAAAFPGGAALAPTAGLPAAAQGFVPPPPVPGQGDGWRAKREAGVEGGQTKARRWGKRD